MKKYLFFLMALSIFLTMPLQAFADLRFELGVSEGSRTDQLDWNIGGYYPAGSGNYVNVLSELTWDDLRVWQSGVHGEVTAHEVDFPFLTSVLRASIMSGVIYDGENRDSDYAGDDRTLEFSRSNNNADEGETFDASIAAGLLFDLGKSSFSVGPFFGYSWHEQQLRMTDGWQTIPSSGPFPGLDSSYDTEWRGPWAGVEGTWKPAPRWRLRLGSEFHFVDYLAVADWNLRADLSHPKSFEHTGHGYGTVFRVDGTFLLWRRLALSAGLTHGSWAIEDGRDRIFFADGSRSETRLNEVNWESTTFSLTLSGRL